MAQRRSENALIRVAVRAWLAKVFLIIANNRIDLDLYCIVISPQVRGPGHREECSISFPNSKDACMAHATNSPLLLWSWNKILHRNETSLSGRSPFCQLRPSEESQIHRKTISMKATNTKTTTKKHQPQCSPRRGQRWGGSIFFFLPFSVCGPGGVTAGRAGGGQGEGHNGPNPFNWRGVVREHIWRLHHIGAPASPLFLFNLDLRLSCNIPTSIMLPNTCEWLHHRGAPAPIGLWAGEQEKKKTWRLHHIGAPASFFTSRRVASPYRCTHAHAATPSPLPEHNRLTQLLV